MESDEGKYEDRNIQGMDSESAPEKLKRGIARAAQGDARAAARLLALLGGEERRAQARTAAAMAEGGGAPLWEFLLEYASLGTWARQKVELPASVRPRTLIPNLTALFLDRQDGPSAAQREAALAKGLNDSDARVRQFAATLLGQWERHIDPGPLVSLLSDPDLGVRLRAARALGRLGDGRALPGLLEALGQSDDLIAGEAADALAHLGRPALQPLAGVLTDHDPHVRWHAAKALAQMAAPQAADALISALSDEDFGVRWLAAKGLAAMGLRAVIPLLRTLRAKEITPWLADGAIHILKNIKEPDVIVLVRELERRLGDSYANVEVPLEAHRILRKLEGGSP